MLNIMMENESQRFANISIPFLILFIMKLIAQINILFFPKLNYFSEIYIYIYKRNNPLLSKSTLKYLVYCQIFESKYGVYQTNEYLYRGWCNCISNNLPREKTVMQMQQYQLSFS